MQHIRNRIDELLNRFTMYRIVLYTLVLLLVVAELFAALNIVSISAMGLLASVAVLLIVIGISNKLFALVYKVPTNTESWLITALILACIMPPSTKVHQLLLIGLTGFIAVSAKFIIAWRGNNILNPAASGAVIMSISGLLGATWWIGSPPMAAFMFVTGMIILRKTRNFSLFLSFAVVAILMLLLVSSGFQHQPAISVIKTAVLSYPLLFLGTIMLTEPSTLPTTRYFRILEGTLVGAIFTSQLGFHRLSSTPEAALVVGNVLALLLGAGVGAVVMFKERRIIATDTYEFLFEVAPGRKVPFTPGQYAEWTLPHANVDDRGNRRTFSIANAPSDTELAIGVKITDKRSSFKNALLAIKPGQRLRVGHIGGDFTLPADSRTPVVMIAGGIGVTPFISMLREHAGHHKSDRSMTLCYVASKAEDFGYAAELKTAEANGVIVIKHVGHLEETTVTDLLKDYPQSEIYISGPQVMVQAARDLLMHQHVPRRALHTDYFSGY